MTRRKKKIFGIIIGIFAIIFMLTVGICYKVYSKLNKFKVNTLEVKDSEIGIKEENKNEEDKIENYLLLGIDKEENATDAIIVVSLNKQTNKIKMISISRDLYVDLGKDKVNKLNYAYHYGGAVNTIKVINETLGLNIRNYGLVTFECLENIVDGIGGVEIDVTEDEIPSINSWAKVMADKREEPKIITSPGKNNLNGFQALAYSRIRKIDSDFKRTTRQRTVINAVLKKAQGLSIIQLDKFTDVVFENIETSLRMGKRLELTKEVFQSYKNGIDENLIPIEGSWKPNYWDNGAFYFTWDKEKNVTFLKDYIYK